MIVVTTPTGRVGRQVLGRIPDGGEPGAAAAGARRGRYGGADG